MLPSTHYEPDPLALNAEEKLVVLNCQPRSTRGAKILIIDDDRDLCLGLRIRLRASYDT